MARFFLKLSYNGSDFNGWQIQDNTPNTLQGVIEEKLGMLLKEKIDLMGCGRTDTGVHARNFIAHFDSHCLDLIENKKHWLYKFNTILPDSIAIQDIQEVQPSAHARFDATQRVYHYFLSQQKNPFKSQFRWYVYGELDIDRMNKAAEMLYEYEDFTSFSKVNTQNKTNLCKVTKAVWQKSDSDEWRFTISSNRFLRGMVRAIVGTMVMVGKNKISANDFKNIIEAKSRAQAGSNAPANALFLVGIKYPNNIFIGKENKR